MKYNDVKTPEQLLKYMDDNIKYGFVDDSEKEYVPWNNREFQEGCQTKWHLSSPERLIKVGYGHCWDQVELERDWFKTHNYNFKTFFIWFELPYDNSYLTHTYLVFENNGKYYYFEHSDFNNRGIYEFETYQDAINYQKEKHIEHNKQRNPINEEILNCLHIYEYDKPIYGCTMNEFINDILENAKEVGNKNKNK
ncbi:MAG: hypothetical protein J6J17_00400 [Bacilli bacterium]|nr:hypothetical protein [Bacilli bacterium]